MSETQKFVPKELQIDPADLIAGKEAFAGLAADVISGQVRAFEQTGAFYLPAAGNPAVTDSLNSFDPKTLKSFVLAWSQGSIDEEQLDSVPPTGIGMLMQSLGMLSDKHTYTETIYDLITQPESFYTPTSIRRISQLLNMTRIDESENQPEESMLQGFYNAAKHFGLEVESWIRDSYLEMIRGIYTSSYPRDLVRFVSPAHRERLLAAIMPVPDTNVNSPEYALRHNTGAFDYLQYDMAVKVACSLLKLDLGEGREPTPEAVNTLTNINELGLANLSDDLITLYAAVPESAIPQSVLNLIKKDRVHEEDMIKAFTAMMTSGSENLPGDSLFRTLLTEGLAKGTLGHDTLLMLSARALIRYKGDWNSVPESIRTTLESDLAKLSSKNLFLSQGSSELISVCTVLGLDLPPHILEFYASLEATSLETIKLSYAVETDLYPGDKSGLDRPTDLLWKKGHEALPGNLVALMKSRNVKFTSLVAYGINEIFSYTTPLRKFNTPEGEQNYHERVTAAFWNSVAENTTLETVTDAFGVISNETFGDNEIVITDFDYDPETGLAVPIETRINLDKVIPADIQQLFRSLIIPGMNLDNLHISAPYRGEKGEIPANAFRNMTVLFSSEYMAQFEPRQRGLLRLMVQNKATAGEILALRHNIPDAILESETPSITADLIREALGLSAGAGESNKVSRESAIGLIDAYVTTNDEATLDYELLMHACGLRKLGSKAYISLIRHSDFSSRFEEFTGEHGTTTTAEWADVINDPVFFRNTNADLFFILNTLGFTDFDFSRFRAVTNNNELSLALRSHAYRVEDLRQVFAKLQVNMGNIAYLDEPAIIAMAGKLNRTDENQIEHYRVLLHRRPRSFSTVVSALRGAPQVDISNETHRTRIIEALDELENVTPLVLNHYVKEENTQKRREFVNRVKEFQRRVLINEPILSGDLLAEDERELLPELITLAFPGTSLEQVLNYLPNLRDYTEHMAGFKINAEGYIAKVNPVKKVVRMREGQKSDYDTLQKIRQIFPRTISVDDRLRLENDRVKAIRELFRTAGANPQAVMDKMQAFMSIMFADEMIHDFRKTNFDFAEIESTTVFLGRATELLGIYFKDTFAESLVKLFENDPKVLANLSELLKPERLNQIFANLQKRMTDTAERDEFQLLIERLQDSGLPKSGADVARLISVMLDQIALRGKNGLRRQIKTEREKFIITTEEGNVVQDDLELRGFVSKNVASFFAKTTAGICTAGDTELFARPDHFHINLVRGNKVIGNLQGYVIEFEGRHALMFRGFNPSATVVNPATAQYYTDGMLNIIEQFAADNGIGDVFISPQGTFHALTNRVGEGMLDSLERRIPMKEENKIAVDFEITSATRINHMFRMPLTSAKPA